MKKITSVILASFLSLPTFGARIEARRDCPACPLEACRWEIQISKTIETPKTVTVTWNKSVETRHMEKPLAAALHCNVDRNFNFAGGGYIKVWFEGADTPCDPTEMKDPSICGVSYLMDPLSPQSPFPIGFTVQSPQGKVVSQVEHLSTLNLQCGAFQDSKLIHHSLWNAKVGWNKNLPGDGTYAVTLP